MLGGSNRGAHGAMKDEETTHLASQISQINSGDHQVDRYPDILTSHPFFSRESHWENKLLLRLGCMPSSR